MKAEQALKGIHNGLADFAIAESIFANSGAHLTVAAARLADDIAEAFGSFEHIAGLERGQPIRMLASFGAMAAELRRLQDENAQLKRSLGAAHVARDRAQKESAALEHTVGEHAKAGASMASRLMAYRSACAALKFGMTRDYPESAALLRAYCADCDAEQRAERGED
jgi:hypothetical protein